VSDHINLERDRDEARTYKDSTARWPKPPLDQLKSHGRYWTPEKCLAYVERVEELTPRCSRCGEADPQLLDWTVCPFDEEINGGDERVWLCLDCYQRNAEDI